MIPGISDVRRLPRLGKIRLGEKAVGKSGKEYPRALDHFNLKDVPEVAKVYGDKCAALDIMIPTEDIDVYFEQARKAYRGGAGLFCKCSDGVNATRVRVGVSDGKNSRRPPGTLLDAQGEDYIKEHGLDDVAVGEMFDMDCPGEECPFTTSKFCRGIGRLMILLPKVPRLGCYQISTTSRNSMIDINSYLLDIVKPAAGRVSMIPLKLLLVPHVATVDGSKKTVHVMKVEFEGSPMDLVAYRKQKALPAPVSPEAMPPAKQLDQDPPAELLPKGGAALEEEVGSQPAAAATPPAEPYEPGADVEEFGAEPEPEESPAQQARAAVAPARTPRPSEPRAAAPRAADPRPQAKPEGRRPPTGAMF